MLRWLVWLAWIAGAMGQSASGQAAIEGTLDERALDPTLADTPRGKDETAIDQPTDPSALDTSLFDLWSGQACPAIDSPNYFGVATMPDGTSVTESLLRADDEVREAYRQVLLARYARELEKYDEARREFGWSQQVGRIIFWITHVVLAIGMTLSVREFFDARRLRKQGEKATENEIKLSIDGIALKTSLNGLAILAVAVGFYYLYLSFVYPITLVNTG